MPLRGLKFYLNIVGGFLALTLATGVFLAQQPDRELVFVREVPVQASPALLDKTLRGLGNWPQWFLNTVEVQRFDVAGRPMPAEFQTLEKGALLRFKMDPQKGPSRQDELQATVTEYLPQKKVSLLMTQDSTGKLTRLFDRLEWTLEIKPPENGLATHLKGTTTAHTHHWRARVFATMAERLLLNPVFYPNLIKLGAITQPSSPNATPAFQH
ncbi:hypothetical protein WDW37_08840 [Bdellovibrionota bacterium FG-1]